MRQRAADDVETIRARLEELRREREQAISGEPEAQPTEMPLEDYACGWRGDRVGSIVPGELTDGA